MKRNGTLYFDYVSSELTSEIKLFCFDFWVANKTTDQNRYSRIPLYIPSNYFAPRLLFKPSEHTEGIRDERVQ